MSTETATRRYSVREFAALMNLSEEVVRQKCRRQEVKGKIEELPSGWVAEKFGRDWYLMKRPSKKPRSTLVPIKDRESLVQILSISQRQCARNSQRLKIQLVCDESGQWYLDTSNLRSNKELTDRIEAVIAIKVR